MQISGPALHSTDSGRGGAVKVQWAPLMDGNAPLIHRESLLYANGGEIVVLSYFTANFL